MFWKKSRLKINGYFWHYLKLFLHFHGHSQQLTITKKTNFNFKILDIFSISQRLELNWREASEMSQFFPLDRIKKRNKEKRADFQNLIILFKRMNEREINLTHFLSAESSEESRGKFCSSLRRVQLKYSSQ